jgi:murein L,D-transpeptidase YafK
MKFLSIILPLFLLFNESVPGTFKDEQLRYSRVQEAYYGKEKVVSKTLNEHGLTRDNLQIYFRAFKAEKIIELWARNGTDVPFELIKVFQICDMSGDIGPKRRSRDLQVPEGFYHISSLNPFSKYYLSLQINYPNASDSIRGSHGHLGNFIFVHGECISSGCLAITNERVKELYVYCVEAYNSGQDEIEFTIFPTKLTDNTYSRLMAQYSRDKDKTSLWADLKKGYDLFERYNLPPTIKFLKNGTHDVSDPLLIKNRVIADSIMKYRMLAPLSFNKGYGQLVQETASPLPLLMGKQGK